MRRCARASWFSGLALVFSLTSGCGERGQGPEPVTGEVRGKPRQSHGHSHAHGSSGDHGHTPPHGGTPVLVAPGRIHLELVLDAQAARLDAYVNDGHFEEVIPVAETNFVLVARMGGDVRDLNFRRMPGAGNGVLTERSERFVAEASWLRDVKTFEGSIPAITLNGVTYTNVVFPFPKGTVDVH